MKGIEIAKSMLGLQEIRDRKKLMTYMKKHKINLDPSTTPWCAAIMNAWEREVGNPGTGKLNARSFLKYGQEIDGDKAEEGDIVVFQRGSNNWEGHVAYFVDWDDDNNTVKHIGGNQSDAVTYSSTSQERILGIRRFK